MPWCDACQSYDCGEYDDDYDDDLDEGEPVRIMPATPNQYNPELNPDGYRLLPQERADGIYYYSDSVIDAWQNNYTISDWFSRQCYNQTPPNMYGYAWQTPHTGHIMWACPVGETSLTSRNAQVNTMRTWAAQHAILNDDWCMHKEGGMVMPYPYAGEYIFIQYQARGDRSRVINFTRFDCAHCCFIAAKAAVTPEWPTFYIQILSRYQPIDEAYLPPTSEIIGETPPLTTATIKDWTEEFSRACSNCGFLNHNSGSCQKQAKRHLKIGIEIEGRFQNLNNVRARADADGLTYAGDGSIYSSPDSSAAPYEFKTKPGNLRQVLEQLVSYYPDETDKSCGMHVHVSFDAADIAWLNTPQFLQYFKTRWNDWGTRMNLDPQGQFFMRLNGYNNFCRVVTNTVDWNRQDRYSQLNFNAWGAHKTVECRLLPMFRRSSLGVAAVIELLSIYEDFFADTQATAGLVGHEYAAVLPNAPATNKSESKQILELPTIQTFSHKREIELVDMLPPEPGMVRVAVPVNAPVYLQHLADIIKSKSRKAS